MNTVYFFTKGDKKVVKQTLDQGKWYMNKAKAQRILDETPEYTRATLWGCYDPNWDEELISSLTKTIQ